MKINGAALHLGYMTKTNVRILGICDSAITRGLRLCARAPHRAGGCFRVATPVSPLGRVRPKNPLNSLPETCRSSWTAIQPTSVDQVPAIMESSS